MKNNVKRSSVALAILMGGTMLTPVHAHSDESIINEGRGQFHNFHEATRPASTVSNELLVEFAKDIAYAANKNETSKYDAFVAKLAAEGWTIEKLDGTTGSASNQQGSTMGVMAFRGHDVIIATRGTEATNLSDWTTNVRYSRNMGWKTLAWLAPSLVDQEWIQQEDAKEAMIAAQFLKADDKIHNGFLQTHMSMYPQVQEKLKAHAEAIGCKVSDLNIHTSGHSLGAAQQDLMQMHLLTDSTLGLGVNVLEKSFVFTDSTLGNEWHVTKVTESKENENVKGVAVEAPRVFGPKAADQFDKIVGAQNSPHIVNAQDIVPHVPFKGLGFEDTTKNIINVDSGDALVAAHTNIKNVAIEALNGEIKDHPKTYTRYFVDGIGAVSNTVISAANTCYSAVANVASTANNAFWSCLGY